MAVDRPTFSESWYRIAGLRPRLRPAAQVHRQHYRGQKWYVVRDAANTRFFRLNEPAYRFMGLLDGQRTVAAVWNACNAELGDEAPTQGEVVELLGQLYAYNLLQVELASDTEALFRRYRRRVAREIRGFLANLLFVRIPLFDPNNLLDNWVAVVGQAFSRVGFTLWVVLILAGLYSLAGNAAALIASASTVLSDDNLWLLYLAFAGVKVVHEFGHGFACKRFGKDAGDGGDVHTMGIMLLVLMPIPFVDASSAWALRSRWQRIVVAAAGMYLELAIAAIAAIVWANTAEGTIVHAISYNIILVASISTLVFNANPLLRYDGYFILSDLLEIPNLAQRGREYLFYLVKRFVWGCHHLRNPARAVGERNWLVVYGITSGIYRVVVCFAILLFVTDKLFIIGAMLCAAALVAWLFVPAGRFIRYLATDVELARVRPRAVTTTFLALAVFTTVVGIIPVPDHARAAGTVEPRQLGHLHAATDGFVNDVLPSGQRVSAGTALIRSHSPALSAQRSELLAESRHLQVRHDAARSKNDLIAAQAIANQLGALEKRIQWVEGQIEQLVIRCPFDGTWVAPNIDRANGTYLQRGDSIGLVASLDDLLIRATADQAIAAQLIAEADERVEIRAVGRPELELTGTIEQILPAGHKKLPSLALGHASGGSMEVDPQDPGGTQTVEPFFEIRIRPAVGGQLLPNQRVVVRFDMRAKPLGWQWLESLRRIFQRRFHI